VGHSRAALPCRCAVLEALDKDLSDAEFESLMKLLSWRSLQNLAFAVREMMQ
jgi:hypothetical protein